MLRDLTRAARAPEVLALLSYAVGSPSADRLADLATRYATDPAWHLFGLEGAAGIEGLVGFTAEVGEATIRHVAVRPAVRGRGIGRHLLAEVLAYGSFASLTAETDANAVGFYRRCGFAVTSLGERYPGVERFRCRLERTAEGGRS